MAIDDGYNAVILILRYIPTHNVEMIFDTLVFRVKQTFDTTVNAFEYPGAFLKKSSQVLLLKCIFGYLLFDLFNLRFGDIRICARWRVKTFPIWICRVIPSTEKQEEEVTPFRGTDNQ